ncbi:MAG: hypothetical protein JWR69_4127, partial [Pedosphaera sp.]|nr:hypothetical protein [Pedosphaera sp.]
MMPAEKQTPMKTIRNLLLIGLTALAVASAGAEDSEAVKKDQALLQDEWSLV